MKNRRKRFKAYQDQFPENARQILMSVVAQSGRLSASQWVKLTHGPGEKPEELAIRLLPLARCFAVAPVSGFEVGAIALAGTKGEPERINLYLGSNMEFLQLPLNQSIHAEQSAVMNAWHQGADRLHAIVVSETPCGYCRQFLNEIDQTTEICIIRSSKDGRGCRRIPISKLLPDAFGPQDLGRRAGLLKSAVTAAGLTVALPAGDRVTAAALSAAKKSYAPYSNNLAGCAIQTGAGKIFSGRTVETAAYNPSLTSLQTAIVQLNAAALGEDTVIKRVALVEKPTAVCQYRSVELMLKAWQPGMELEYFEAE
jgi:cytidine deaminase